MSTRIRRTPLAVSLGGATLAAILVACGSAASPTPSAPASDAPSTTPSRAPTAVPSPSEEPFPDEAVVTLRVGDEEEYRILLTAPDDIEIAQRLLAGEPAPTIPNGVVVRGDDGGVNAPWSWHIDPATLEWAELTIEVCDGLPSDVEADAISGERFCPWSAEVIDLEPR